MFAPSFSPQDVSFSPIEPSWAGPNPPKPNAPPKHFERWLCDAQNHCTPYEVQDFTENINWRIFRIMAEFIEGFQFLSKLKNEVTFFGGVRAIPGSAVYESAYRLGCLLGKAGYTVITGGGPGVMEAGNKGAYDVGGESIGIDIELPREQRRNPYVKRGIGFNYFFTRKVMMSASAQAYIFFPGGFGTMDELFEMVTLIQTGKMSRKVPVILVGKTFWTPMLAWIREMMLNEFGYIEEQDFGLLQLVETPEEAFAIIAETHERPL